MLPLTPHRLALITLLAAAVHGSGSPDAGGIVQQLRITINTTHTLARLPSTFVAMGWEMDAMIGNVAHFNDTRFRLAASHLSPAVVRVGGITADWVRYTGFADAETRPPPSSTSEPAAATSAGTDHKGHGLRRGLWGRHPGGHSNTLGGYWPTEERNLTLDVFTQLYDFMAAANLSLMLDLNELHGRNCHTLKPGCSASNAGCWFWCTGPWDTSNVRQLLQYLHDRGLVGAGSPLYAFELGNELVSHMTAQQTTADIVELAGIIQSIWSDHPAPKRPGLYAPSTDACQDAEQLDIMRNISNVPGVAGFSFHGYPAHNGTGTYDLRTLLLNATWLRTGILTGTDAIACIHTWKEKDGPLSDGLQLLVTEASSSYNWQLPPPAQNSFLHTIFTVAELGQYAATGVGMVARWSFAESSPFATLTYNTTGGSTPQWDVAADYWVMLAHKATVGGFALGATNNGITAGSAGAAGNPDAALVYVYCGRAGNGSLTVAVSNPGSEATAVHLFDTSSGVEIASSPRMQYIFTAPPSSPPTPTGDLSSTTPVLNGNVLLRLAPNGALPASFTPAARPSGSGPITVPPYSAAYFEIPGAGVAACRTA